MAPDFYLRDGDAKKFVPGFLAALPYLEGKKQLEELLIKHKF